MSTKQFVGVCLLASMVVFALAPLSTVRAEDTTPPETIDVVASGVGMNETEATKDALANAVRQAIGAIVGTDTLIQNEEIVRDQILTYSDGFAKNYELVGKPSITLSGLASVTIRARIVRSKLIQKAKAANIAVVEVDGKGMFAEAVTKMEQNRSAKALIEEEFRDMPQRLIKAEIVGEPRYDEKTQKAKVVAQLSVDEVAYRTFVDRLTKLLDGIGGPSFAISSVGVEQKTDRDNGEAIIRGINFGKTEFPEQYRNNVDNWRDDNYAVLAVCSIFNQNMSSSRWRMYILDTPVMEAINARMNCLTVGVELIKGDGQVVDCHYFPLGLIDENTGRHYEGPITFDSGYGDDCDKPLLFVVPFVDGRWKASEEYHYMYFSLQEGRRAATHNLEFDLTPDELAEVANVVCKVTPVGLNHGH